MFSAFHSESFLPAHLEALYGRRVRARKGGGGNGNFAILSVRLHNDGVAQGRSNSICIQRNAAIRASSSSPKHVARRAAPGTTPTFRFQRTQAEQFGVNFCTTLYLDLCLRAPPRSDWRSRRHVTSRRRIPIVTVADVNLQDAQMARLLITVA